MENRHFSLSRLRIRSALYGESCLICPDHTAELADISLADPWTYQRDIGVGKTFVIIRTKPGLEILRRAVESGYIEFEEIPELYAVQYTTLLKKTVKVTVKESTNRYYMFPPSIASIIHELDYKWGNTLARDERLWPLLRLYMKVKYHLFRPLIILDCLLKPGLTKVLADVSKTWLK